MPSGPFRGFHIRWWALWMEEARGVPLSALQRGGGRGANATAELLTRRVDGEQVGWAGQLGASACMQGLLI